MPAHLAKLFVGFHLTVCGKENSVLRVQALLNTLVVSGIIENFVFNVKRLKTCYILIFLRYACSVILCFRDRQAVPFQNIVIRDFV